MGLSGAELLLIVDEASGVPDEITDAIEGNLAAGGKLVLFSNPTRLSGLFYDSHTRQRDHWHDPCRQHGDAQRNRAGRADPGARIGRMDRGTKKSVG